MTITWEFPSTRITDAEGFVPVDIEGVHYGTREALNARKKELAHNLGVSVEQIHIEGNGRRERNARADDAGQRHVDGLRRSGYDEQSWNQRKTLVREDPALRARYISRQQRQQAQH
jgi:hypothetical protein